MAGRHDAERRQGLAEEQLEKRRTIGSGWLGRLIDSVEGERSIRRAGNRAIGGRLERRNGREPRI